MSQRPSDRPFPTPSGACGVGGRIVSSRPVRPGARSTAAPRVRLAAVSAVVASRWLCCSLSSSRLASSCWSSVCHEMRYAPCSRCSLLRRLPLAARPACAAGGGPVSAAPAGGRGGSPGCGGRPWLSSSGTPGSAAPDCRGAAPCAGVAWTAGALVRVGGRHGAGRGQAPARAWRESVRWREVGSRWLARRVQGKGAPAPPRSHRHGRREGARSRQARERGERVALAAAQRVRSGSQYWHYACSSGTRLACSCQTWSLVGTPGPGGARRAIALAAALGRPACLCGNGARGGHAAGRALGALPSREGGGRGVGGRAGEHRLKEGRCAPSGPLCQQRSRP